MSRSLWLRWSARDLRQRWLLVTAIALIIALGTGTYAGLGSTAEWRRQTNDASFATLRMHDVRITLAEDATVPAGRLEGTVRRLRSSADVAGVEERLVVPTQVDASTAAETILVPSELVGVDPSDAAQVDRLWIREGRALTPADDGRPVAVLEHQFAEIFDLPPEGTIEVSGGRALRYVGVGANPQHLLVTGRHGSPFAQGGYAVVFVPLGTAQELGGTPGAVNEVVVRLRPGTDAERFSDELLAAVGEEQPGAGATATLKDDEPAYRMLYEDIESDQRFWDIIAALVLLGATFASFNLVSRMVEAQRREIGIGMALGVPRMQLARRPLLVGAEVALIGVVAGVLVGFLLDLWLRSVFESVLPMPEWRTPFQPGVFGAAALIGFVLPFVATAVPVWRALRVQPVDAIRTGHLAASGSGLAPILARIPMPGRIFRQMPFRNVLRTPRRTGLTVLAIAASITTMVAIIGTIDSFVHTLDVGEEELLGAAPDRLTVELDGFSPTDGDIVRAIAAAPEVGVAEPRLQLFGTLEGDGESIDVIADLLDFDAAPWRPTLAEGTRRAVEAGGIVLARKAAGDLGVGVGDRVGFRHPRRVGAGYELVRTTLPVAAIHPSPVRNLAYLDLGRAPLFRLEGLTNAIDVRPADGVSMDTATRALFETDGVASVESTASSIRRLRDALAQLFGVLRVAQLVVLLLALLIAFNSTSISVDERAREHATMQAFGLRARTILGMVTVEGLVTGVIGAAVGLLVGGVVVRWLVTAGTADTMPDLGVLPYVSVSTVLTAFVLAAVAVTVAPLLAARRVRHTDIPSALRVME